MSQSEAKKIRHYRLTDDTHPTPFDVVAAIGQVGETVVVWCPQNVCESTAGFDV